MIGGATPYADFRGSPAFLLDGLYGERVAARRMRRWTSSNADSSV
jgi:hypothetical protein